MNREQRAEMLAHLWTKHTWPMKGDQKMLTLAMIDDEETGVGLTVSGDADAEDLAVSLVSALLGEPLSAPAWIALTGTVYFDSLPVEEALKHGGNLEDDPTPTTQHGLMVVQVDGQGVYSTCWKVDLTPEIDLPEEPVWSSDEAPVGRVADMLQVLFGALTLVGGGE